MNSLRTLLAALTAASVVTASIPEAEISPAGTWVWTVQDRQGAPGFEQSVTLDYQDGKLTGTMAGVRRGQFSVPDTEIANASYSDGTIRFEVTREFNEQKFTTKYEGRLEDGTIRGTFERPAIGGKEPEKREWIAKRAK
jgi:hypothetical protein